MEGSGKEKMDRSGGDTWRSCCWMLIESSWHLGCLISSPQAPQPVGLTPVGLTCLLSVGTDLVMCIYSFSQSSELPYEVDMLAIAKETGGNQG